MYCVKYTPIILLVRNNKLNHCNWEFYDIFFCCHHGDTVLQSTSLSIDRSLLQAKVNQWNFKKTLYTRHLEIYEIISLIISISKDFQLPVAQVFFLAHAYTQVSLSLSSSDLLHNYFSTNSLLAIPPNNLCF